MTYTNQVLQSWGLAVAGGMVLGGVIVAAKLLGDAWLDWQVSRDLAREKRGGIR